MSITSKRDFVELVRRELPAGASLTETERLVDAVTNAVKRAVNEGHERIVIPQVVTLTRGHRAARTARNPFTGEPVEVAAKDVLRAKVSGHISSIVEGK